MKLIDKIKTALFEEDEEEKDNEVKEVPIAKKIDIDKTQYDDSIEKDVVIKREDKVKKPIIFDDEDFMMDFNVNQNKEVKKEEKIVPVKEERILYGGYDKEYGKSKEKFKPSQVLSPVYGVINVQGQSNFSNNNATTYESIYKEEKSPVDIDSIRKKAYGEVSKEETKEDLVVDIRDESTVAVDKITLGDAEEYFNDLGLEYNVDYEDKEKNRNTRAKKNKNLTEMVEEEIKENKKIKKELEEKEDRDDIEEKNLYDLIDMMYDNKE